MSGFLFKNASNGESFYFDILDIEDKNNYKIHSKEDGLLFLTRGEGNI